MMTRDEFNAIVKRAQNVAGTVSDFIHDINTLVAHVRETARLMAEAADLIDRSHVTDLPIVTKLRAAAEVGGRP